MRWILAAMLGMAVTLTGCKMLNDMGGEELKTDVSRVAAENYGEPPANAIWGDKAGATSELGTSGAAVNAAGAPDMYPKVATKNCWLPQSSSSEAETLEVGFPETEATEVHIFEVDYVGSISEVRDDKGGILFSTSVQKDAWKEYGRKQAHVLVIKLPKPRKIKTIKVTVAPKASGHTRPAIDAIGLLP